MRDTVQGGGRQIHGQSAGAAVPPAAAIQPARADACLPDLPGPAIGAVAGHLDLQDLYALQQVSRRLRMTATPDPHRIARPGHGIGNRMQLKVALTAVPPVTALHLARSFAVRGADLERIGACTDLQALKIGNAAALHDEDLAHLQQLPLQSLDLANCIRFNGSGLAHLSALTQLKALRLNSPTELSGTRGELAPLNALTGLESLDLSLAVMLDQSALAPLTALTRLRTLDLSGNAQATDAPHLRQFPALERLHLDWQSRLNDRALANLAAAGLPLRHLTLSKCHGLTQEGFGRLAQLRELVLLDLSRCRNLRSSDLPALGSLPNLRTLGLRGCDHVSPQAIDALRRTQPELNVVTE